MPELVRGEKVVPSTRTAKSPLVPVERGGAGNARHHLGELVRVEGESNEVGHDGRNDGHCAVVSSARSMRRERTY